MTRLAVLAPVALLAAACARFSLPLATVPTPRPASSSAGGGEARPALTIVLGGSLPRAAETRAAIERALGRSFALTFAAPPSAPPGTSTRVATVEQELAAVRRSYIDAEFQPCLEKLGEIQRVGELLAEGERTLGERLLFWRIACLVGAGRLPDARRDATVFATYGLSIPPDVEAAAPDVEALVAEALRAVAFAPRHPLRVSAVPAAPAHLVPHAVVSLDGRVGLCVAPCTLDVPAGDHAVRVDADGFTPASRLARVEEPGAAIAFSLSAAEPALAARQWTARHAGEPAIDAAGSVALLATALRARSLAVLAVEPAARGVRLAGALGVDGGVGARSERVASDEADVPDSAVAVLRDLLLRGQLLPPSPPLHARPLFWVGVGLAAVAAATVTTLFFYEPERRVELGF